MVALCIFISRSPSESTYVSILSAVQQNHPRFIVYVILVNPIDREQEFYLDRLCSSLPNVHFFNVQMIKQWHGNLWKLLRNGLHKNVKYIFALNSEVTIGEGCLRIAVRIMEKSDLTFVQFASTYWGTYNSSIAKLQEPHSYYHTHILKINSLNTIKNWCETDTLDWEKFSHHLDQSGHKIAVMD